MNGARTRRERSPIGGDRTVTVPKPGDWRSSNWRPEIERFIRHKGTVTPKQVADRFRLGKHKAAARVQRMLHEGTLEQVARGLYRVRESGPC